jgi:hypothetical protein
MELSKGQRYPVKIEFLGGGVGTRQVWLPISKNPLVEAASAARDADVIWLQVWKEAPWAIGFYARMGFAVVGSALFYFGEQIGHDHIMARPIERR